MDFILKRIAGILTRPRDEWLKVKEENITLTDLFAGYAVVLATLPAAAEFISFTLYGRPTLDGFVRISQGEIIRLTVISYVFSLVSVYILGYLLDAMAPYFGCRRNLLAAMQVIVYSHTAAWISGIFLVIPELTLFALFAGIYSLFLLYTGMKEVLEVPRERMTSFFLAVIFASVLVSLVILMVSGMLLN